jgi:hypothetical protein
VTYRDDSAAHRDYQRLLQSVTIASPCTARWDEMDGDDRVRRCRQCEHDVYDLSAVRADEAAKLLAAGAGQKCLRMFRRHDGTVLTSDCPSGAHRRRIRRAVALSTAGVMSTAFVTALQPDLDGIRAEPNLVRPARVELQAVDPPPEEGQWILGRGH